MQYKHSFYVFFFLTLFSFAQAMPIGLRVDHPDRYTVREGDTLWGIAERFLQHPWQWPWLWKVNQQRLNAPDRLYPGDTLVFSRDQKGLPHLRVESENKIGSVLKLSPKIRKGPIAKAIPTIAFSEIKPFLSGTLAIEKDQLKNCGYVLAFVEEHIVGSMSNLIYARGLCHGKAGDKFTLFRQGKPYTDPDTKKVIAYEATEIGHATLERSGDPATLMITQSNLEIELSDRLTSFEESKLSPYFMPRSPEHLVSNGKIVAVLGGLTEIGQNNVVVLNRGREAGLSPGHVLYIYKGGNKVFDPVHHSFDKVQLPQTYIGELMVFRALKGLSYALVMQAIAPVHVSDEVGLPEV